MHESDICMTILMHNASMDFLSYFGKGVAIMEKKRLEFEIQNNIRNTDSRRQGFSRRMLQCGVGFAHAVMGAVVLLIRSNPLNPLSHIR